MAESRAIDAKQPLAGAAPDPDAAQAEHSPRANARPLHESIAQFVVESRYEDLSAEAVEKAKAQIVYLLGLAFAGRYNYETDIARSVLAPLDQGPRGATVIGDRIRLSLSDAAFSNAIMMRATFLDDVMFPGGIHPGVTTLPAALAAGELTHASGPELLLACVLGYEVLGTLSTVEDEWHRPMPRRPTMIFGGYGPVTVAGRLFGLDTRQLSNAFGYAANLCMGVPEGGQMDHFYGFFSRNGMLAVQLARAGGAPYSGYTLEGALGLYASSFGRVPPSLAQAVENLGTPWRILAAEYKRHFGTSANTVAVELLLDLLRQHALTGEQVAVLRVALSSVRAARKEAFARGPFATPAEAYASLPYALARALIDGRVESWQYADAEIRNPVVAQTVQRIDFQFEEQPARYCRLEIETRAGVRHVASLDQFAFPFPRDDWLAWLQKDGNRLLGKGAVLELERQIRGLEGVPDVSRLVAVLRPSLFRHVPAPLVRPH
jgi:2-methylcitrate dehydratase PrpD